jgi:DNA-binding NarL/FixJ family response regulator
MLWLVSKDIHLAATFARKFYWTELNLWPEDLPEGSSVVLSGADALVSAADIHKMLSSSGVQVSAVPVLFIPFGKCSGVGLAGYSKVLDSHQMPSRSDLQAIPCLRTACRQRSRTAWIVLTPSDNWSDVADISACSARLPFPSGAHSKVACNRAICQLLWF